MITFSCLIILVFLLLHRKLYEVKSIPTCHSSLMQQTFNLKYAIQTKPRPDLLIKFFF